MNSEDSSKSADDGAKGVNISSSVSTSVENRQDNVHAKSDCDQGMKTIMNTIFAKLNLHFPCQWTFIS